MNSADPLAPAPLAAAPAAPGPAELGLAELGLAATELSAPAHWQRLAFISDVHLHAEDAETAAAFVRQIEAAEADALFLLGDIFEVWVGDDALEADAFSQSCAQALRRLSQRCALYFMPGNRDFLAGAGLMQACGAQLLADPTLLRWGEDKVLLSHGDALCLEDAPYLAFRAQVRGAAWQEAFLARPLAERQALARQLRAQSQKQQAERLASGQGQADVDASAAKLALQATGASLLIHGHTHRPARHALGPGLAREVLSDWDARARPPRVEVLRLDREPTGGLAVSRCSLA